MPVVRAYVGLGANVGDAETTLARGVAALAALPGCRLRGVSRLYATEPWGVVDQPEFRNAAVALDVPGGANAEAGATALLVTLKDLERAFGRRRRGRWGPREIDLDLLLYGAATIDEPGLTVPHPFLLERAFVLEPLTELVPELEIPGNGTVREALAAIQSAS